MSKNPAIPLVVEERSRLRSRLPKGAILVAVLMVFLVGSVAAQVFLIGKTLELKKITDTTQTEIAKLEEERSNLQSSLTQVISSLEVEQYAQTTLQMSFAHASLNSKVVYLTDQDLASLAQANPGHGNNP